MRNRLVRDCAGRVKHLPKAKKDRSPQARQGRRRRFLRPVVVQTAQDRPGVLRLLTVEECYDVTIRKEVTKILWLKN